METCPVLVLSPEENSVHIKQTNLYNYTYNWPIASGIQSQAFPLGLGSLFNHSNQPRRCNVGWTKQTDPETRMLDDGRLVQGNDSITYVTLRRIEAGEELCISYGPKERLTFVDVEDNVPTDAEANEGDLLESVKLGLEEI